MARHAFVPCMMALLLLMCIACSRQAAAEPGIAASADLDRLSSSYASLHDGDLLRGAKTYQKLMAYKHSLTRGQLQRSLVYKGANVRLRKVVNKLLAGQNVSVGVIGGSISWGHMVQKGVEDWFALLSSYMRTTFKAKLTFKNGCVPATQSEYVSVCLKNFVDSEVDLVFVEYATNDGYMDGSINNSAVQAFERLLRNLLQFKNAPAVVLMEFLATDVKQNNIPFYATAEDQYGVLAQYYGIPWLSFRNLIWHGFWSDKRGFSRNDVFFIEDERHPTPVGHKYMADMAVNLIQQTYVDSLLAPLGADVLREHASKVPGPLFPGNYESSNLVCIIGDDFPSVVVQKADWDWVNEGTAAKPKWGFVSQKVGAKLVLKIDTHASSSDGNVTHKSSSSRGIRGSSSKDVGAAGSGQLAGNSSNLPGSSSNLAGNSSSLAGLTAGAAVRDMIVWIGYLKSWRLMGSATISCIEGCECTSAFVDGMHEEGNTQQYMARLLATQHEHCLVEVKINDFSRSKGHKLKVTGVMVTRRIDYLGQGDFTDQVIMDAMTSQNEAAEEDNTGG